MKYGKDMEDFAEQIIEALKPMRWQYLNNPLGPKSLYCLSWPHVTRIIHRVCKQKFSRPKTSNKRGFCAFHLSDKKCIHNSRKK